MLPNVSLQWQKNRSKPLLRHSWKLSCWLKKQWIWLFILCRITNKILEDCLAPYYWGWWRKCDHLGVFWWCWSGTLVQDERDLGQERFHFAIFGLKPISSTRGQQNKAKLQALLELFRGEEVSFSHWLMFKMSSLLNCRGNLQHNGQLSHRPIFFHLSNSRSQGAGAYSSLDIYSMKVKS